MDDIQHWSTSNNYWKWQRVRMPSWLTHFFDFLEFIWESFRDWALNKLFDLAFEALRDRIFPRLIKWWRKSQPHQQYRDIATRIVVVENVNAVDKVDAEVWHAASSNSP